jgi:hypothetical protein
MPAACLYAVAGIIKVAARNTKKSRSPNLQTGETFTVGRRKTLPKFRTDFTSIFKPDTFPLF